MQNGISRTLIRAACLLLLAATHAWACSQGGSTTITNFLGLGGSSLYVYALGSGGDLTG